LAKGFVPLAFGVRWLAAALTADAAAKRVLCRHVRLFFVSSKTNPRSQSS
jgi:hypothetical protein